MSIRKNYFSGTFYPDNKSETEDFIANFNSNKKEFSTSIIPRAIIVPHAGYVYSGSTANIAYDLCKNIKAKRVIVIGPSHRVYVDGASISLYDEFETPLGNIDIDLNYAKKISDKYDFVNFDEEAHYEHSTEVQMPFIKNYLRNTKVVELIYGQIDFNILATLIEELLKDSDNFIVISTDLSHFYNLEEANKIDKKCMQAINEKSLKSLANGCEACGLIGVKAILKTVINNSLKLKFLDYKTSYETNQDSSSVVGYCSFLIGE